MALTVTDRSRQATSAELAKEVLRSFGRLRFVAQGSSMLPAIFPGDVLFVHRESTGNFRCGDIVLASRGENLVAHRIVRIKQLRNEVSIITRGDSLRDDDPPISGSNCLGRVFRVDSSGRRTWRGSDATVAQAIVQWLVQRSDIATKCVLYSHSLRKRWARRVGDVSNGQTSGSLERC